MDITQFTNQTLDTNWITIVDPRTGEDTDIKIELNSPDSKEYQKVLHELGNKRLQKMQRKSKQAITAEQVEQEGIELLAYNTVNWAGITENGQEIPCNYNSAYDLYKRFRWLREQVDDFMGDRRNFFKS